MLPVLRDLSKEVENIYDSPPRFFIPASFLFSVSLSNQPSLPLYPFPPSLLFFVSLIPDGFFDFHNLGFFIGDKQT